MGIVWPIAGLFYAASLSAAPAYIVAVYESGVDAYTEAMEGIGAGLDPRTLRHIDLQSPAGGAELTRELSSGETRLVIAVGSRALAEVQARRPSAPLLATMVLRGGVEPGVAHMVVDIPLGQQLQTMRTLLPRASRVGIIRNPARSRYSAEELAARARKDGLTATVVDCDGPAQLLKAIASFKGRVDFVLCFPDAGLYNAVTIKPLVMAGIEDRLPLVGFSPAFVRAGAAAGIYPDYREIGRQTAAMAQRLLRGEAPDAEEPSKVKVAINQRVARLLGVDFQTGSLRVEVLR